MGLIDLVTDAFRFKETVFYKETSDLTAQIDYVIITPVYTYYIECKNLVGNIVGKVNVIERENNNGESFKVANFSVISKNDKGNKVYHNCSAYGEKGDIPKDFKQGDFVKLFGQERKSIDDNGKEHTNVRILASKLLKAKEQMKSQEEKKESVLGAIKKFKAEEKAKPTEKKEAFKEAER